MLRKIQRHTGETVTYITERDENARVMGVECDPRGRFTEPASLFDMLRTVGSDRIKVIAGSREVAYDISIDIEWVVESGL